MITSILSMWIWRIGFSYVLGRNLGWGVFGVWVAMTIDWVFRGFVLPFATPGADGNITAFSLRRQIGF